ncbi:tyrosine-type recombinase/integrase [Streptomyces sp. ISL-43]|nr:tyrosine-type recombinase/integrase [Streptomyces sp. ISL-43]
MPAARPGRGLGCGDQCWWPANGGRDRPARPDARNSRRKERQEAGPGWTDNGLVFTTPKGKPLDPGNLTRRFRRLLHSAGLRTIRFHDLRHSTATLLLEQGVDLVVIKELLGHAHIGVTAGVYANVRLRLQRQAIDALGDVLGLTDDPNDPPAAAVVR